MSGAGVVTGAVCAALTGLGFVLAVQSAQKGRYLRATRWVGLALIPIGLYLTGLATLGRRVGSAVADWATDLAFGVTAWAGVAVLAVSVGLLLVVRMIGARSGDDSPPAPEASGRSSIDALLSGGGPSASGRSLPQSTSGQAQGQPAQRPGKPAKQPRGRRGDSGLGPEFDEIEEILRRRGI
ncbi:hypothetical protein [Yinghuangia seranimata]|uniref:hypothetical protein n=1 Tax=Yinghuangia seranimata TaxID=408067 RepID=UPI00248B255F|nr:hypothetical protein [Yinghuangia seranimata]MDI2132685.1 hypothetical protein [Yinghuangia seranimata]